MRHRKAGVKLSRTSSHRKAMFRNMTTSLLKYNRIQTTDAKAKELRSWADHLITLAKRGDLHARRQALSLVREKDVVHKLFEEAADRFGDHNGGYTRIIKAGRRPGDAAPVSIVELIDQETRKKKKVKKKKEAKKEETPSADLKQPETPKPAAPEPAAEAPATGTDAGETETASITPRAETFGEDAAPAAEDVETPQTEEKKDGENAEES